jgi:hypothetical protein
LVSADQREKLVAAARAGDVVRMGMFTAVSADGLNWADHRPVVIDTSSRKQWVPGLDLGRNADLDGSQSRHEWWKPGAAGWAGGDNFPCLLPLAGASGEKGYVAFFRTNIDRRTSLSPQRQRRERGTGRAGCATFGDWGPHELAFRADPTWQRAMGYGSFDYYQMQVWRCGQVYLGLVSVFHWSQDRVRLELAWSPDTVHWERVCPGQDIIPLDEQPGSPCFGGIYAAMRPCEVDGQVRVYFGASSGLHNAQNSGTSRLMLALFQSHRFAGLGPRRSTAATIVTRLLDLAGGPLSLDADAARGVVRAELRHDDGSVVPGYEAGSARPVTGDGSELRVTWSGRQELPTGRYRIALTFEDAILYAMRV